MNILNSLAFVVSILSIIVAVFVYKRTRIDNMKMTFLKSMMDIYCQIEEDAIKLIETENTKNFDSFRTDHYVRRIKANCALLIYYVDRIPGYSIYRDELWKVLILIMDKPQWIDGYKILSDRFYGFIYSFEKCKTDAERNEYIIKEGGYPKEDL